MTSTWNRYPLAELEAAQAGRPGTFSGLVQSALGGAATALGVAEASAAYAAGERDPNRLTDIVFRARHPERRGRPITAPETRLRLEWRWIRGAVVLPALRWVPASPAAPALPSAPTARYTLPPDPAQLRTPARTRVDAVPLFPGGRAFDAEVKLIRGVASRPGGWVYLANWYASLAIAPPKLQPVALALAQCVQAGGTVRALFWDGSLYQLDPVIKAVTAPLLRLGGTAASTLQPEVDTLIREYLTKQTNHAVNSASAAFINDLRPANAVARLDDATLALGSHHQKLLVVGNDERQVAVMGGVDLNPDRIEPPRGDGTPLFDISLQFDGQAAADVADLFERRWNADAGRRAIPLPRRRPPTAAPPATGATVQIGANFGCRRPLSDVPHAVRGGSELIKNLLSHCRAFFYAEDQYGVGNSELEAAIKQAFANGARFGVVVLAGTKIVHDIPEIAFRRHQFWSRFPQTGKTLLVFERFGDDAKPDGPHAYVHSKLVLVDDLAASISSLNMSRRSWYHDSELAAVVTDAPDLLRDLRVGIWSSHLALGPSDDIRDPAAAFAVWQAAYSGSRMSRVRPLSFAQRPARASDDLLGRFGRIPFLGGEARSAIDAVLDQAFDLIYDPTGPFTC